MAKFRAAQISDLPILNQISVESKKYWNYPDEWISLWINDLTLTPVKLSNQKILLAEVENQIIGFCSVGENPDIYEILHLWLLPSFIGKGYGKQLLEKAIGAFTNTDKPIIVEADPNAESFYESCGFTTFDQVASSPQGRFLPLMKR